MSSVAFRVVLQLLETQADAFLANATGFALASSTHGVDVLAASSPGGLHAGLARLLEAHGESLRGMARNSRGSMQAGWRGGELWHAVLFYWTVP